MKSKFTTIAVKERQVQILERIKREQNLRSNNEAIDYLIENVRPETKPRKMGEINAEIKKKYPIKIKKKIPFKQLEEIMSSAYDDDLFLD